MSKKIIYETIISENQAFLIRLEKQLEILLEDIEYVKNTIDVYYDFKSEIEGQEMERENYK